MSAHHLYYCYKCKTFVTATPEKSLQGCPDCKMTLKFVPVNMAEYDSWSDAQKAGFQETYLESLHQQAPSASSANAPSAAPSDSTVTASDSSFWIGGLEIISWIVLSVFVLAGIIIGANAGGLYGLVAFVLCAVVGFLLVGITMVFLGMAHDLKAIRNKIEKS